MVKNPSVNAGGMGLTSGWETKIPHSMGQETHMPQLLSPRAWSPCGAATERVHRN